MKYTFKQITGSYTTEKKKISTIWARCFSRPISFLTTYFFINLGFSANAVSVMSMIDAIIGCVLLSLGGRYMIAGGVLIVFWDVLDCTDGNIARVKKQSSYMGEFIDAMSGYSLASFVFIATGMAAYHTTNLLGANKYFFILIGGVASISDVLTRLIHQRYTVAAYRYAAKRNQPLPDTKGDNPDGEKGLIYWAGMIMKTFGFSNLFMPLLIISLISMHFDYLIIFYCAYTVTILLAVYIVYIQRAQVDMANKKTNNINITNNLH